jgi:hypothetical protein
MKGHHLDVDEQQHLGAVSCVLDNIVKKNDARRLHENCSFSSTRVPDLSIHDYVHRLSKYFKCSSTMFVLVLMYIDEVIAAAKTQGENIVICSQTVHRLIITTLVVAVKYFEDSHYSNRFYAEVGGISLQELNKLETAFLLFLKWDVDVDVVRHNSYSAQIQSHCTHCSSCGRLDELNSLALELRDAWSNSKRQKVYPECSHFEDTDYSHKGLDDSPHKHSEDLYCTKGEESLAAENYFINNPLACLM